MINKMVCNGIIWRLGLLISFIPSVFCVITCDGTICDNAGAYCCGLNNDICCFVYDYWWFWFIWICVLVGIISCSYCCIRRRRLQANYFLIRNQNPSQYGTVVTTTTSTAVPPYPTNQPHMPSYNPPPQYQPNQKPPIYTP